MEVVLYALYIIIQNLYVNFVMRGSKTHNFALRNKKNGPLRNYKLEGVKSRASQTKSKIMSIQIMLLKSVT